MNNLIELVNITIAYGKKQILEKFNYKFEKGKSYVILGRSGCGKSSLLKLIAGLLKQTKGIIIKENGYKTYLLHQNYVNYPWLSVLENTLLPIKINRKITEQDKEQAKKVLEYLGLQEHQKMIYELSGGQQQRLALARLLMANPDTILLDEPTSALDEETTLVVESILKELKAKGKTLITVTHNKAVAERLADEIINL